MKTPHALAFITIVTSLVTLMGTGCPPTPSGEGEGEGDAAEGEGAEGEGAEGEGAEGEGAEGEGAEGEGAEGEGAEGEGAEGEGAEGEGAEGEGAEGEGAEGEGAEGEGAEGEGAEGEGAEGEGEGQGNPPTCDPAFAAPACGGGAEGSWAVTDICAGGTFSIGGGVGGGCVGTIVSETLVASGGLDVTSTTFSYTATASGDLVVDLNATCAVAGCGTAEIAGEAAFQGSTWTCAASASGCTCDAADVTLDDASTGTYTEPSTGELDVLNNGNNHDLWLYCVDGGGSLLREDPNSDGVGLISPTYVLSGPN